MAVPTVSVIIPTFNRLSFLREAVNSVRAQTVDTWELFVIDDGSTDGTIAYLDSLGDTRIHVIACSHTGHRSVLRNHGVRAARGTWIAFLDSDDLWHPDKLERQLDLHAQDTDLCWSYTNRRMIAEDGTPLPAERFERWTPKSGRILSDVLNLAANIALPTVMVRRQELLAIGAFDERWAAGEDYELWVRLAERFKCGVIENELADIRSYASSTFGTPDVSLGLAAMYEAFAMRTEDAQLRDIAMRRRPMHLVRAARYMIQRREWGRGAATLARATAARPAALYIYRTWLALLGAMLRARA